MTRITLPASVVHALCNPMPDAKDFMPTRFTPASTKAWFAGHTVRFLSRDCPRHQFTRRFYNQLVHCFSTTPHYGLRSFWTEYFTTTLGKIEFIEQVLRHSGYGMPSHIWCDVEREISRRLRQSGLLDLYRRHSAGEQDAADRVELARLITKYGQCGAAVEPGILRTELVPTTQATPIPVPRCRGKDDQLAFVL